MLTLVIGGAGSGKSAFAEKLICATGKQRIYLATMTAQDEESLIRIEKHQKARSGRAFTTIECGTAISSVPVPAGANVLLEDLSNLLANEMFSPEGSGVDAVREGIRSIWAKCENLVLVTNEIFSDGVRYEGETLRYLKELAELNREFAEAADLVVEVVCGLPNVLKGSLPL